MTTCLMVYAHCDDEVIWGHPWLTNRLLSRRVLICSSDRRNPERQQYHRGEEALQAACNSVGIESVACLIRFYSSFYRLPARGEGATLRDWWEEATKVFRAMSKGCDFIVTHNPHGEYAHMDHLLVRRMVLSSTELPVQWSSPHWGIPTWPQGEFPHRLIPECKSLGHHATAEDDIESLKEEYISRDAWTWDFPVLSGVNLFEEQT